jgi:hypothetical protein
MLLYPRPDSAIAAMAAQQQHLAGATSSSLPSADGQFECDTEISSHLLKHQSSIGNHASNLSSKGCSSSPQAKRLHLAAPCSDGHTLSAPVSLRDHSCHFLSIAQRICHDNRHQCTLIV